MPKAQIPAVITPYDGEVLEVIQNGSEKVVTILLDSHETKTSKKGKVSDEKSVQLDISSKRVLLVKKGDKVKRGELITDGSADIEELFNILGAEAAQEYIATEVTKVYELQGATISRKHLDIIVRQMFNRVAVVEGGDSKFSTGDVIPEYTVKKENREVKKKGGVEAKYRQIVQGITQASLTTESWLSAASFQNTTKILIKAATRGQMDELIGLKENVIAGRLVPVGTGYTLFNQNKKIKTKEADELNGFIDKDSILPEETVDESNEQAFMDEKTDNA